MADDWKARLTAQLAQTKQRRERQAQQRAQLAAARAHGLRRRHARKLTRIASQQADHPSTDKP